MSVHGYPADMSIFCNLQLGLLKLQEDMPQADIDQDNVSLAGVLQGAVATELVAQSDIPVFARRSCWAIIRVFRDVTRSQVGQSMQWGRRFPNPSASHGRRFCSRTPQ